MAVCLSFRKKQSYPHGYIGYPKKNDKEKNAGYYTLAAHDIKTTEKATPGTLTPTDKTAFFIPDPNPRTNSIISFRIADAAPVLSLHTVKHLEHVVDAHNPETPESKGLPDGVVFVWLLVYVGTAAPTAWTQFSHLKFCTKFRNVSNFLAAQAKSDVWYTACYIGESGEMSNFSPFLHSTIAQTA
jgi:hypothetical protein